MMNLANVARMGMIGLVLCGISGCTTSVFRPQSPDGNLSDEAPSKTTLIHDVAHSYGMNYVKVEAVSLVTSLAGTGDDPPPSPQRATIMAEMNRREVNRPNDVLASPNTSLVLTRSFLRPGIQEGDRFDVEVRTAPRSNTTSLRGGKLLESRMTELAVLGDQIRKGHVLAISEGSVLVDPSAGAEEDEAHATRGRILGGGVATKSRNLGLILDHQHKSVQMSQQISKSIGKRFHSFQKGQKQGVATPKTDEFIELHLHPRYKDNVGRYMRVVRNIAIRETNRQLQSRLAMLKDQLLDPVTTATAAIRLEAIGNDEAIAALRSGIEAEDPEVRFYAAEALAYLDITEAVEPLALSAREEPAFRINALAALSAMDDGAAYDALRKLLNVKSAETRYGAFRALWAMTPADALIRGENLGGQFSYHTLAIDGPPMIHATSSHRAEIVLFGAEHQFQLPLVLDAGSRILVNGLSGAQITISRFEANQPTQQRVVSTDVDQVIRAVVELGGTYPDIVQMLQQAKQEHALGSRFRVNALPQSGREFHRKEDDSEPAFELETPRPELFGRR